MWVSGLKSLLIVAVSAVLAAPTLAVAEASSYAASEMVMPSWGSSAAGPQSDTAILRIAAAGFGVDPLRSYTPDQGDVSSALGFSASWRLSMTSDLFQPKTRLAYSAKDSGFSLPPLVIWGVSPKSDQVPTPWQGEAVAHEAVLTPALWNEVRAINTQFHRQAQLEDQASPYGVEQSWGVIDDQDLAALKRDLLQSGIPSAAISISTVATKSGRQREVLILSTDRGDYVLDGTTPWVLPLAKSGYGLVKQDFAELASSDQTQALQ